MIYINLKDDKSDKPTNNDFFVKISSYPYIDESYASEEPGFSLDPVNGFVGNGYINDLERLIADFYSVNHLHNVKKFSVT